jgi:hypothetical protein
MKQFETDTHSFRNNSYSADGITQTSEYCKADEGNLRSYVDSLMLVH